VCDGLWGEETKVVLLEVFRQARVPITVSRARNGDRQIELSFSDEPTMLAAMNTLESFASGVSAPAAPPAPTAMPEDAAPIVTAASGGMRMPDWGWGVLGAAIIGGTFVAWRLVARGR
jgi:hypothetical protein